MTMYLAAHVAGADLLVQFGLRPLPEGNGLVEALAAFTGDHPPALAAVLRDLPGDPSQRLLVRQRAHVDQQRLREIRRPRAMVRGNEAQ